jgi:predicted metal-dependent hydrolase
MNIPEQLSVKDGQHEVSFELRFSNRKSVGICVTPRAKVQVTAPEGTELDRVLQAVQRRIPWIITQLKGFEEVRFLDDVPGYESGQTIKYLGRNYMLRVYQAEEFQEERVVLEHSTLRLDIKDRSQQARINLMIEEWLRNEALAYLGEKFEALYQRIRKYDIQKPQFYLRRMDKRWGSCTPNGVVYLNPDLIRLPSHCIEYAIMHELCHLKHGDHSTEYYLFLDTVMPDWKIREKDLHSASH